MDRKGINVIVPLGGLGKRFSSEGFIQPKPLVRVLGKSIISWVLGSLKLSPEDRVYIVYHGSLKKANFEDLVLREFQNITFTKLANDTRGAAETVLKCLKHVPKDRRGMKTICIDGDTFYHTDILAMMGEINGNGVFCFNDHQEYPIYSYVRVGDDMSVSEIAEKKRISNLANTGCYVFETGDVLEDYCRRVIKAGMKSKGEYYVSMVIKMMLGEGHHFKALEISRSDFSVLGTPLQVKLFATQNEQNFRRLRICFDIDNTILTYPRKQDDYSTCEPIDHNVDILRFLESLGHTIILYTARRMRTHSGNIGSVLADIGETTLESLRRYDIPFHEIYFGKPYADFYIDDLAINTQSNIEKEIGVYRTKIRERGFNNIDFKTIETVRKASNDLEKIRGEVHWYENIPESVNDLFPRFLGKSSDGYSYELEKITGVAMTYLFINQLVTTEILHQLLLSLERIHSSTGESIENSPEVDIYANYSSKMKIRYDSFDYSELPGSEEVFEKLQSDLGAYASQGLGEKCIIHGDPVFSNIIIKENNEFMFIDMRGEIDGKETIFGDKWYDFGKVYQSIIGYDEILMNTITNREYKAGLKRDFEEYISKNYGEERMEKIKLITNSLIFSLLPLHDSDLVTDFYGLIEVR